MVATMKAIRGDWEEALIISNTAHYFHWIFLTLYNEAVTFVCGSVSLEAILLLLWRMWFKCILSKVWKTFWYSSHHLDPIQMILQGKLIVISSSLKTYFALDLQSMPWGNPAVFYSRVNPFSRTLFFFANWMVQFWPFCRHPQDYFLARQQRIPNNSIMFNVSLQMAILWVT